MLRAQKLLKGHEPKILALLGAERERCECMVNKHSKGNLGYFEKQKNDGLFGE